MNTILLVDDDSDNLELLSRLLSPEFTVLTAASGEEALRVLALQIPDAICLDLRMPGMDGAELCRRVRATPKIQPIPVLMVSVVYTEEDRIQAFEAGVDDFIQRPFSTRELILRLRRLIGRLGGRSAAQTETCFAIGNLKLSLEDYRAQVNGREVRMTKKQFELLNFICRQPGRVISRKQILEGVWPGISLSARTIDTHLVAIRKALSGCSHSIESIHGVGYRLTPERAPDI